MLSAEALDLFGQLLGGVQLSAADPDLAAKSALVLRVRDELAAAIKAVQAGAAEDPPTATAGKD